MKFEDFKKEFDEIFAGMSDGEFVKIFTDFSSLIASITPIMKKLYKIIVLHGAPKDTHTSIEGYVIAKDEEQVYDYINKLNYGYWENVNKTSLEDLGLDEEERSTCYYLNDDYNNQISFKEWLMAHKGDLDDEAGWEDAYYGVTKYGWEEMEVIHQEDLEVLVDLKVAVDITEL